MASRPDYSHVYDNETIYFGGIGWNIRTYTEDGEDYTMLYEMPSDKGWITDLILKESKGHLPKERIEEILEKMNEYEPRGDHGDVN